jgi:predicted AlkP superfamily phosphohydrolase/phosphomutase
MAVDGLDWDVVRAQVAAGKLPTLQRLLAGGARAELDVTSAVWGLDLMGEDALLSPMLWTTAASGTYYFSHGIYDFRDFLSEHRSPRLFSSADVLDGRIWDALTAAGKTSLVVGYMLTHPAAAIQGVMLSDLFGETDDPRVAAPAEMADELSRVLGYPDYAGLRAGEPACGPMDATEPSAAPRSPSEALARRISDILTTYLDEPAAAIEAYFGRDEQSESAALRALLFHRLIYPLLRDDRFHRAFLHLLEARAEFSFATCYYRLVDVAGHGFWADCALAGPRFRARYGQVMPRVYQRMDSLLAEVWARLGKDDVLIVMSDHGFAGNGLRQAEQPCDDLEFRRTGIHRAPGFFVAGGGRTRAGEVEQLSILDVAPTILDYLGLPQAHSFDGGVVPGLLHAAAPRALAPVEAYPALVRPVSTVTEEETRRMVQHLAALGYLES